MPIASRIAWDDTVLPFQLDHADIRGRVARLDGLLGQILSQHAYPAPVEALVAEAVVLTALMGHAIKLRWKLSLQIRGNGPVRIVATDYYAPEAEGEPARIRAWASFDPERLTADTPAFDQIGEGYFAILMDQGAGTEPYSGITPIAGGSLATCAETYFGQSEQLPTRFQVAVGQSRLAGGKSGWRAGGVMLQHMPASGAEEGHAEILTGQTAENWNRVNLHLDTVEALELIGPTVQPTELLVRLFHEEQPRIFDPQGLQFGCSCSEDKVRQSLSIYSAKEIVHMTTEDGRVTADCQFCGAHYVFDPHSLGFEASATPEGRPNDAG